MLHSSILARKSRGPLAAGLAGLALAALLAAAPAPAQTAGQAASQAEEQATQAPAPRPAPPQRRDNVFGTMDENMRMGRDPETGDVFMRVEPPPPPAPSQEQQIGPIEVHPELNYPAPAKKQ